MRRSWELPDDLVRKILKMAEPTLRVRAEVHVQSLRDRAHMLRILEGALDDVYNIDKPEHLRKMCQMSETLVTERHQLLQLVRLVQ